MPNPIDLAISLQVGGTEVFAGDRADAAISLSDIAVNWIVYVTFGGNPLFGVVNQTLFAALVVVAAPLLWRWFRARARAREQADRPPYAGWAR